jgi:hypothetical protein
LPIPVGPGAHGSGFLGLVARFDAARELNSPLGSSFRRLARRRADCAGPHLSSRFTQPSKFSFSDIASSGAASFGFSPVT